MLLFEKNLWFMFLLASFQQLLLVFFLYIYIFFYKVHIVLRFSFGFSLHVVNYIFSFDYCYVCIHHACLLFSTVISCYMPSVRLFMLLGLTKSLAVSGGLKMSFLCASCFVCDE